MCSPWSSATTDPDSFLLLLPVDSLWHLKGKVGVRVVVRDGWRMDGLRIGGVNERARPYHSPGRSGPHFRQLAPDPGRP